MLQNIINEYNKNVKEMRDYCIYLYNYVLKLRISNYYKNIYINYIINYYHKRLQFYKNKRDEQIRLFNSQNNSNSSNTMNALIVGIDYLNTINELNSCIEDALKFENYLKTKHNTNDATMSILTDNTTTKPTRQNILDKLKALLNNSKSGDKLFFIFSGHGYYITDYSNDELDGKDELICCVDEKFISDDEVKKIIDDYLKENVSLFILLDCCHSGTMIDLKYNYFSTTNYDEIVINDNYLDTKGNVYLISGCRDNQVSEINYVGGKYQSLLTWAFLEVINNNANLTWKELLIKIRGELNPQFTQIPQLSTGKRIDVNSQVFM